MQNNFTENDLSIAIYQSILKARQEREIKCWHASSLAMCPRAQFFARKGVKPLQEITAAKELRFKVGDKVEDVIRPYIKELFPDAVSNVRFFNKTLDLSGEVDNYSPKLKTIIEVKSVHPAAVRYRRVDESRNHLRNDSHYTHHEYQQRAYKLLMEHPDTEIKGEDGNYKPLEAPLEVEGVVYLYISLAGLLVPYLQKMEHSPIDDDIIKRITMLNLAMKHDTPPECLCGQGGDLYNGSMQYCPYRTTKPDKNNHDPNCCSLHLLDNLNKKEAINA